MKSVAENIRESFRSLRRQLADDGSTRVTTARERRAGNRRFLGDLCRNHQHLAADFKKKLFTGDTHRRSETRSLLQALADKRREMAKGLKARLDQHHQDRTATETSRMVATGKFLDEVKLTLGDLRGDLTFLFQKFLGDREKKVSSELRQARKIWIERSRPKADQAPAGKKGRKLPAMTGTDPISPDEKFM